MNYPALALMALFAALMISGIHRIDVQPYDVRSGFLPIVAGFLGLVASAYFY